MNLLAVSCVLLSVGFALQGYVILCFLNRIHDLEAFRDAFLDSISKITNEVSEKMDVDQEVSDE